jgi:hypothetical protein
VIGVPPSKSDGIKAIFASSGPLISTDLIMGALAVVGANISSEDNEASEVPTLFVARTVKVYFVPGCSPVTVILPEDSF